MRRVLLATVLALLTAGAMLWACTFPIDPTVQVDKVEIDCVVVELPGGQVETHCPDAATDSPSDSDADKQ